MEKNFKVRVLKNFKDLSENKSRKVGEEFDCTEERYNFLKDHNAVELIKSVEIKKDDIVSIEPTDDVKDEDLIDEVKVVETEDGPSFDVFDEPIAMPEKKSRKKHE